MDCTLEKKLQGFQLIAQEKLQAIICSIPGKKDLILEQTLIKPLEHVCAASWLKLKGIQRIYKFDNASNSSIPVRTSSDQVHVFMIHSQLDSFQRVLRHIHEQESPLDVAAAIKNFHIICVPTCFTYFQCLLEEEGLYGLVQLHRFNWDFIYLDQGVLCLEIPSVFPTVYLQENTSLLPSIAHTLRILQMMCGRPMLTLTYGENAGNIVKMLNTLNTWNKKNFNDVTTTTTESSNDFSAMLVIDRNKDYVSSLLTPAIYAGLLLEVFPIRAGEIELETNTNKILDQKLKIFLSSQDKMEQQQKKQQADKTETNKANKKPNRIRLNSLNDEIYGENRYKHFTQASSLVRAQATKIGLEVHKLNDMKLDEMHDYVARKLPKISELKVKVMRHLNASEKVIEMLGGNFRKLQTLEESILNNISRKRLLVEIDELLTTDGQQYNTIRLICLMYLCAGLSSDELTQFMHNYCTYFGYQHMHVFEKLVKAGLLPAVQEEKLNKTATRLLSNLPIPKFQQTEFQANANRLKLLVSSSGAEAAPPNNTSNTADASCPSYVFNGLYIPLVAQLCSILLKTQNAEDFAGKLALVDNINLHLTCSSTAATSLSTTHTVRSLANSIKQGDLKDIFPLRNKRIFVLVVGGITYAEIGACNLICKLTGAEIIVSSDSIVSGADLIASAFT